MTEQKIAVIGCGVWGRNIVRNFYNLNVLDTVCDIDEENLKKVTEQYPGVKVTKDHYIGIMNHTLVEDEKDKVDCLINTIKCADLSMKESVLVIYGKGATEEDKARVRERLASEVSNLELSEVEGGQDVYDFNVALF